MASTTTQAPTPDKAAPATAPLAPVQHLPTPLSTTFTFVHIPLVLGLFYSTLPKLIADPTQTLLVSLVPVLVAQGIYLTLCLSSGTSAAASTRGGKKKQSGAAPAEEGPLQRIVPAILSLVLTVALATPLLSLALVLFGAPVATHQLHTLLCGAHLAALGAPALFFLHGVAAERWRLVAGLALPVDEVFGAALGTLLGAWVGAVPIPLDWDREWQRWPVTVVVGAYAGWALGKGLGGTVGRGLTIKLN